MLLGFLISGITTLAILNIPFSAPNAKAESPLTAIALNVDGDQVAIGCQSGVYLFSAREALNSSGWNLASLGEPSVSRPNSNGTQQPLPGKSVLLNWTTNRVQLPSQLDYVHDVAFHSNGELLAVAGGTPGQFGQIELFNVRSSVRIAVLSEHDDVVTSLAWMGNQLFSVGYDGKVSVYTCSDSGANAAATSNWVLSAQAIVSNRPLTSVRILEKSVRTLEKSVRTSDTMNRDLCIIAGLDQTIQIYDAHLTSKSKPLRTLNNHVAAVLDLAVIPGETPTDPHVIASVSEDRTVRFWYPETGRLLRFMRLEETPLCTSLSRVDGRLICLAGSAASGPVIIDGATATRFPIQPDKPDRCSVCLLLPSLHTVIYGQEFPELQAVSIHSAQ